MKNLRENTKKSLTNHFRGVEKSHIFYDSSTKKWVLESLKDPTKKLETVLGLSEDIPIGSYKWIQKNWFSICKIEEIGYEVPLVLSKCFEDEYTCDSGHCIELFHKCDTEINCKDKSDEHHCR